MKQGPLAFITAIIMLLSPMGGIVIFDQVGATKTVTEGRGSDPEPLSIPAVNGIDIILEECETINLTDGGQTQFLGFYDDGPRVADNGDVVFIADLGQCDSNGGEMHEGFGYFHYILEYKELHQIAVHDQTILGHTLNLNYVAGTIGLTELIGNDNGDLVFSARTSKDGTSSIVVMAYYSSSRTIELLAEKYGVTPHGDRVWCGFENLAINDRGNVALLGDELTDENCYTSGEEYGSIYIYGQDSGTWVNPEISDEMNVAVDGGAEFGQNCGKRTCDISLGYNDQVAYIDDSQAYGEGGQCSLVINSMGESSAMIHTADYCYDMELKQVNQHGDVLFLLLGGDDNLPDDQRRTIYRYSEGVKKVVAGAGGSIEMGAIDPNTIGTDEWQSSWGAFSAIYSSDVWMDEEGNVAFLADAASVSGSSEELTTLIFHDIPPREEVEDGIGPTIKMVHSSGEPIFSGALNLQRSTQDDRTLEMTGRGEIAVYSEMLYDNYNGDCGENTVCDDLVFFERGQNLGKISLIKDEYPTPLGGSWSSVEIRDVSNQRHLAFMGTIVLEEDESRTSSSSKRVFATTADQDLDGLLDEWETGTIRHFFPTSIGGPDKVYEFVLKDVVGLSTPNMNVGASPLHKDIFIEIDYMKHHRPNETGLKDVINAFANSPVKNPDGTTGINLHIVIDEELDHKDRTWSGEVVGIDWPQYEGADPITGLILSESSTCPSGYYPVPKTSSLNRDLNQGAGGKNIYLCYKIETGVPPITQIAVTNTASCPPNFDPVPKVSSLDGNLNQEAGGKSLFLCFSIAESQGVPYTNLHLSDSSTTCPSDYYTIIRHTSLNGDLNQEAGGKSIYLCFTVVGSAPITDNFFGTVAERSNPAFYKDGKWLTYRYVVFAHSAMKQDGSSRDGLCGAAGAMPGRTVVMYDADIGCGAKNIDGHLTRGRSMRSTFMHELGHTLGLGHGGNNDVHFKPNYQSIMNYAYDRPITHPGSHYSLGTVGSGLGPHSCYSPHFTTKCFNSLLASSDTTDSNKNGKPNWLDTYNEAGMGWSYSSAPDYSRYDYSIATGISFGNPVVDEYSLTEQLMIVLPDGVEPQPSENMWILSSVNDLSIMQDTTGTLYPKNLNRFPWVEDDLTDDGAHIINLIKLEDWNSVKTKSGDVSWSVDIDWNNDGDIAADQPQNSAMRTIGMNINCPSLTWYPKKVNSDGTVDFGWSGGYPCHVGIEDPSPDPEKQPWFDASHSSGEFFIDFDTPMRQMTDIEGWNDWINLDLISGPSKGLARSVVVTPSVHFPNTTYENLDDGADIKLQSTGTTFGTTYNEQGLELRFEILCQFEDGCLNTLSLPRNITTSDITITINGSPVSYTIGGNVTHHIFVFDSPQGSPEIVVKLTKPTVIPEISASATSDVSSGAAPLTVVFSVTVSGGSLPYGYTWDFGDGSTGTGEAISHQYATAGDYTVVMVVTDALGTTVQDTLQITVSSVEPDEKEVKEEEKEEESSIPYPGVLAPLCILALVSFLYRRKDCQSR